MQRLKSGQTRNWLGAKSSNLRKKSNDSKTEKKRREKYPGARITNKEEEKDVLKENMKKDNQEIEEHKNKTRELKGKHANKMQDLLLELEVYKRADKEAKKEDGRLDKQDKLKEEIKGLQVKLMGDAFNNL